MTEPLRFIEVTLVVRDVNNVSDDAALRDVREMICEVFGKEERQDHPRSALVHISVKHKFREPRL